MDRSDQVRLGELRWGEVRKQGVFSTVSSRLLESIPVSRLCVVCNRQGHKDGNSREKLPMQTELYVFRWLEDYPDLDQSILNPLVG